MIKFNSCFTFLCFSNLTLIEANANICTRSDVVVKKSFLNRLLGMACITNRNILRERRPWQSI